MPGGPSGPDEPAARRRFGSAVAMQQLKAPLARVTIAGNTTIPREAILAKVKTRGGRRASEQQIRDDLTALYDTGWFKSVEPQVRQSPKGLILVFQVREHPVLRSVTYRGNRAIKTRRLAAITGLRPNGAFDVSANRESVRSILREYHERGFNDAKVTLLKGGAASDRDVIFSIHEGQKVAVVSVKFSGNGFFSSALLKTKLQTKRAILGVIGGKFDPATLPADVASIKKYYESLGFFDVKISKDVTTTDVRYNPFRRGQANATIHYKIEEGARYRLRSIVLEGNEIFSDEQLRQDFVLKSGEYFNGRHLNADVESMTGKYGDLGRLFARVVPTPRFLDKDGVVDLVYKIDEDEPYTIRRINVHVHGDNPHTTESVAINPLLIHPGQRAVPHLIKRSESRLSGIGVFESAPGKEPRLRVSRVKREDLPSIAARGQNGNWWDEQSNTSATPAGTDVVGPYNSIPGQNNIVGPSSSGVRPAAVRPRMVGSHQGVIGPFSSESRRRIVRQATTDLPQRVVNSNAGNTNTRVIPGAGVSTAGFDDVVDAVDDVLGKPVELAPDNPAFDPNNPAFYNNPQGNPLPNPGAGPPSGWLAPPEVDVDIDVWEARTGRLMFGVGVNSDAGLVGSFVLQEDNFDIFRVPTSWGDFADGTAWRGRGQKFRLEAVPGSDVSRYLMSWSDPYVFDTLFSVSVSGFFYNRYFDDWTEDRLGGRLGLGRQFTNHWSGALTFRGENVEIRNPHIPTPQILTDSLGKSTLTTFGATVTYDDRDRAFLPTEGFYAQGSYEQAFGEYSYPRFQGEVRQYFTVYKRPDDYGKHILSFIGNVGWTGDNTPIFERFYAGGYQSFRGFAYRGVSPVQWGTEIGGQFQALGSVEYKIPLTASENVQVVGFTDFGTVEDEAGFNDVRVTVGAGLRLTVPAMGPVPIALDWGFPVRKQNFDDTQVFSFYIGINR